MVCATAQTKLPSKNPPFIFHVVVLYFKDTPLYYIHMIVHLSLTLTLCFLVQLLQISFIISCTTSLFVKKIPSNNWTTSTLSSRSAPGMLDRLNPDYATLTPEYQQATLSNKGIILQQMIGPLLIGNPGSSANPSTSLSIAHHGLNLNEDQLMEEAM